MQKGAATACSKIDPRRSSSRFSSLRHSPITTAAYRSFSPLTPPSPTHKAAHSLTHTRPRNTTHKLKLRPPKYGVLNGLILSFRIIPVPPTSSSRPPRSGCSRLAAPSLRCTTSRASSAYCTDPHRGFCPFTNAASWALLSASRCPTSIPTRRRRPRPRLA